VKEILGFRQRVVLASVRGSTAEVADLELTERHGSEETFMKCLREGNGM